MNLTALNYYVVNYPTIVGREVFMKQFTLVILSLMLLCLLIGFWENRGGDDHER